MALVLGNALADRPCAVYTSDARVQLAEKRYLYPDVTVACGEQAGMMLTNPVVVIEVLSPYTTTCHTYFPRPNCKNHWEIR